MKTAFLAFMPCKDNLPTEENFVRVGKNSGNIVFSYALQHIIRCESIFFSQITQRADDFDNIIVRDFISLREETDLSYFNKVLDCFKQKPIIPISVGVQAFEMKLDFRFHPATLRILQEVAERAVLAVRGEYSAYVLNMYGIKNIRVVGCPSMYLGMNHNRKIIKKDFSEVKHILSNYKTISNRINTPTDLAILNFLKNNAQAFVEQTRCYASESVKETTLKKYSDFLFKNQKYFFIFEDWYNFVKNYDFCIGGRFHGNVVPILAGVPALFLAVDSRTKEMTDFFDLPTVLTSEFDASKPLEYYYDLADYTEFNKNYSKNLDNFIEFCKENNLEPNLEA